MKTFDENMIATIRQRLSEAYHPLAIFLFGSMVWGNPADDSDVDVCIVVPESREKFYKRPIAGYRALRGFSKAVDILVYTQAEFRSKAAENQSLCSRILQEGAAIYGGI